VALASTLVSVLACASLLVSTFDSVRAFKVAVDFASNYA
jgi:hypothetical protein